MVASAESQRLRGMIEAERECPAGRCSSHESRKFYRSLTSWKGLKRRLPSCKLAATKFGDILSPHSIRETKHIFLKTRSGCTRKIINVDLLPQVVEDWVLIRFQTFLDLAHEFQESEVSSCASRPIEALVWINEIRCRREVQPPGQSCREFLGFLTQKIATDVKKIINGDFKRRVFIKEDAAQTEERYLTGRQDRLDDL